MKVMTTSIVLRCGLLLVMACAPLARAQQGDKKGEVQMARVPKEKIPPAPALSPDQALKTFKLAPGFRIELVASEPMIEMPIIVQFDADGRMWVVEMRSFMPNVDGTGEQVPISRVSILEDTDGDGRMDKRTIFLDGLVMPRALALVRGGALLAEPPHLWFCRDTHGDGRCDEKVEVFSDYGSQAVPEHTANGLLLARDNWIYSLYHTNRYRFANGKWMREPTFNRAQWGLAQDDFGRLFYTSNSEILRGDLIPSHYLNKVSLTAKLNGLAAKIVSDQSVWPIRVNPGVNRGYQPNQLRADGTLATVTAACGTCIYRGDNFPEECRGNAFVCEPAGNVVKRNVLTETDGIVTAKNAYHQAEFLASTDERFRPVNAYTGPDGALYIVDMYHGILQHRIYVTTYLRHQIEDRQLQQPQNQGRIYRVVYEASKIGPKPNLSQASSAELVRQLAHPNGWWRDTAQRLLTERADAGVVPDLHQFLADSPNALARLGALWTLEGMGKADAVILNRALGDAYSKIRAAAVRMAENLLRAPDKDSATAALRAKLVSLAADPSADVQIQVALSLGEIIPDDKAKQALKALAQSSPFALAKDAAAFSIAAREPKTNTVVALGPPLSPEDQKRFETGKAWYEATCVACHQPHGMGQAGLAPPLVGSEWVNGPAERLARIVLHGLRGPITVNREKFELDMPALGVLDDDQVAAVLTYVRREWGHTAAPVAPATIKKVREATAQRDDAWTEPELLKVP
jgi:mono/diheme cytochrome c family protein/glucose/arabinose dehydrogenase